MRTNIEIDEELIREAMVATGAKTKRSAIETALQKLIEEKRQEQKLHESFRQQEVARKQAEHLGRLEEWQADLLKKGNWPQETGEAG